MGLTIRSSARLLAAAACTSFLGLSAMEQADAALASFPVNVIPIQAGSIQFDAKLIGVHASDVVSGNPAIRLMENDQVGVLHPSGNWAIHYNDNNGAGGGGLTSYTGLGQPMALVLSSTRSHMASSSVRAPSAIGIITALSGMRTVSRGSGTASINRRSSWTAS